MLLVEHYKKEDNKSQEQLNELFSFIKNYTEIIDKQTKSYRSINWFKRLFAFSERKSIQSFKKVVAEKQKEVSHLKTEILERKKILLTSYTYQLINGNDSEKLAELKAHYSDVQKIYDRVEKVKSAGERALSKISSAISSVDSASNMESLDMVTSNKGISLMSHSANSTASSDIASAKYAIEDFKEKSNDLKSFFSAHQEMGHLEQFDFISDLFFENSFSDMVFGMMILGQLSSARSSLVRAFDSVESSLEHIEPRYQQIKEQKNNTRDRLEGFIESFEVQARKELADQDINLDQVDRTST